MKNKKMTSNKINTILWIALIVLITLSYFFSEKHIQNSAIIIGLVSVVKFLAVGFQFMETKHAHNFWKILLIFFSIIYLTGIVFLY